MSAAKRLAVAASAPLLGGAAAILVTTLLFIAVGVAPVLAWSDLVGGAFGSRDAIGYTLFYTTDLVFTGLAVAIPYRAGLFNIGAEGQVAVAGIAVALVCRSITSPIALPLALAAAAAGGALWACVPAWLEVRRGSNVVLTTIMFNFLAAAVSTWLLVGPLRQAGDPSPETAPFTAALPALIAGTPANPAFILALVIAGLAQFIMSRTVWGFELDLLGAGRELATYAGVAVGRVSMAAMCLGGAFAGLMALNELLGAEHRLVLGFSAGFGFLGIAVALMADCQPLLVVLSALLFGALYQGGTELALDTPKISQDIIMAINGAVVLIFGGLRQVWRRLAT